MMTSSSTTCPEKRGCPSSRLKRLERTGWTKNNLEIICNHVTAVNGSANSGTRLVPTKFEVPSYNYCCLDDKVDTFPLLCSNTAGARQAQAKVSNLQQEADSTSSNITIAIAAVVSLFFLVLVLLVFLMFKRLKLSKTNVDDKDSVTKLSVVSQLSGITVEQSNADCPFISATSKPTPPDSAKKVTVSLEATEAPSGGAGIPEVTDHTRKRKSRARTQSTVSAGSEQSSAASQAALKRKSSKLSARVRKETSAQPAAVGAEVSSGEEARKKSTAKPKTKKEPSKRRQLDMV